MVKKNQFKKICSILISLILIALIAVSSVSVYAQNGSDVRAEETVTEKITTTHDIAIVFDNSGSMYTNDSWSQALYAIGVFASMLDYEAGDKLGIYPMGEISIGKNGEKISERLEITEDNISGISKIYCKSTSDTILKPAYSARKYLKASQANEKWLIVLTDGEFYFDKSRDEEKAKKDAKWLNKKMLNFADDDIKVQYIGFAEASVLKSNISHGFYATNVKTSEELTSELVDVCNKIFQRHKVENVSNGAFSIDVSMNNIIAFVQGKGAKINSLKASGGKDVESTLNTKVNAGTEGTGNKKYPAPVADVKGQVVAFNSCESGSYKLDFTGSDVQLFYEPNVIVQSYLTDKNGETVDTSQPVAPGEYILNYGLVDAVTGKDVSSSKLLAPVNLSATVKNNGNSQSVASGQTITLGPDSETHLKIAGTYLNEYKISNENEKNSKINIEFPQLKTFNISMSTKQPKQWYVLSKRSSWEPIRIDVSYDGEKLSDKQMKKLKLVLEPDSSEALPYSYEIVKEQSAFEIKLGVDKNGNFVETKCDDYKLTANVVMKDEFGRELQSSDSIHFDIQRYAKFWVWLTWLLVLLALIAIIIFILNLPAWPAKMVCVIEKPQKAMGNFQISPSGGSMRLVPFKHELSATVKKNTKLKDKFGSKANIMVVNITPNKKIQSFTIGSNTYTRENKFLDGGGKPFTGVIRTGTKITLTFVAAPPLTATIKINK